MRLQYGIKEHKRMLETYEQVQGKLIREREKQIDHLAISQRYWKGEAADTLQKRQTQMLLEGEYDFFLKNVTQLAELYQDMLQKLLELQRMVGNFSEAYGIWGHGNDETENLFLDEKALLLWNETVNQILTKNRVFYDEMCQVMYTCTGIIDFSQEKKELDDIKAEIEKIGKLKTRVNEYASGMKQFNSILSEQLEQITRKFKVTDLFSREQM